MKQCDSKDNSLNLYRKVSEVYFKEFIEELKIVRGETILDFGCGRGSFADTLVNTPDSSHKLYLYDKDKKRQFEIEEKFKNHCNVYVVKDYIEFASIRDGSLDRVILHFVLHEIELPEIEQLFLMFRRVMKFGGFVNIRDPLGGKEGLDIQEIEKVICGSGFAVEDIRVFEMPFQGRAVSISAAAA